MDRLQRGRIKIEQMIIPVLLLMIMLVSCGRSEKQIEGVYVKDPSVNTIDTLWIHADSLRPALVVGRKEYQYEQVFYNRKTGSLLFRNKGAWWLENGKLQFMNFYFDTGNVPADSYTPERLKNDVILFSTSMDGDDIIIDKGVRYKRAG